MSVSGQYSRVISTLGHGVSLQPEFFGDFLAGARPEVDFMELSSDGYVHAGARAWAVAARVRQQVPVTLHGHGLSLGDVRGPRASYLDDLADIVDRLEPVLVSDHLCWSSDAGHFSQYPLPLPRTAATLKRVVRNVTRTQERLKRRILVENVTRYVEFSEDEMTEAEFLCELASAADCWLRLDVSAAYINGHNLGVNASQLIESLPSKRIQQLSLGGFSRFAEPGASALLIDSRAADIADPIWDLYRVTVRHASHTPTVVQREARLPPLQSVVAECARARRIASSLLSPDTSRLSA